MRARRTIGAVGGALLLCACAGLPPPIKPLTLPPSAPLAAADNTASWPKREWWRDFQDDRLDALIAEALAVSPDLAAAQARVDAARAAVAAAAATYGPQINGEAQAARERISDHGLFSPKLLGFNWYNQFDLGLSGSFDLGGPARTRPVVRAAAHAQQALEAERDGVALALPSEIARTYWGWQVDQARLALAQQSIETAERLLRISAARIAADIGRVDETQSAQLELLTVRRHAADLEVSARLRLIVLAALVGRAPAELPSIAPRALPPLRQDLPATATIDLLARRADIVAARWQVEARSRQQEFVRRGFYPDISLQALLGVTSRELGLLLQTGSAAPMAALAVHLPLFDSGALRANYARATSLVDEAVAHYRGTVVAAAREVNSQLAARANAQEQSAFSGEEVAAADALRASAEQRFNSGLTDERPLLAATQQWLTRQDVARVNQFNRADAELELIRVLGGGYQMEPKP